jgi:hypothetical protein
VCSSDLKPRYPVSVEQMHEAVIDAVAEKEAGYVRRKNKAGGRKARQS